MNFLSAGQCVSLYGDDGRLPGRHLREVVARAPEVGRERPLQVLVAVEGATVEDLDVDRDAGGLRLLSEHLRTLVHPEGAVCRLQVDREPFLPGRLEQRLRLLDVLVPLRQRLRERLVERGVEVVADLAVARERLRHHLRPVGDQPHRLPHADVVERGGVDPHADRRPRRARRLEHLRPRVAVDDGHLRRGHVRHRVDLAAEQRVHPRRVVREVDDHDLVEVGLPGTASSSGCGRGRSAGPA